RRHTRFSRDWSSDVCYSDLRERSGFSENITTGADLDDEDNWSVRGQLLFTPSDSSRLLLGYDYVTDDSEGNARVPFPVFDTGQRSEERRVGKECRAGGSAGR